MSLDPYAPPKAALTAQDNTTYLEQDGYAFQNELIANRHFKSPPICAKLGIPIPPESLPEPKLITVTRSPRIPQFLIHLTSILSIATLVIYCSYTLLNNLTPAILIYVCIAYILKYILTKPYKIPFYLSEEYTRLRKNRILTFSIIFIILGITTSYGIISRQGETITFSILALFITLIIYKFKTTYFVVTQTKGEFHHIRGVHQGLLNALPHIPLSS